jgi:hypothetical protein
VKEISIDLRVFADQGPLDLPHSGWTYPLLIFFALFLILSTSAPNSFGSSSSPTASANNPFGACSITSATSFTSACKWQLNHTRVAVVNSLFTSTAYFSSSGSFYTFYGLYGKSTSCVTQNLNLLNLTIYSGWSEYEQPLQTFVTNDEAQGLLNNSLVTYLTDGNVNSGALFQANGVTRKFDVVILGFSEYLTQKEYNSYEKFVASGGKLITMDGSNFLAQVNYNSHSHTVSLVLGHGWSFDGTQACPAEYHRWLPQNANWIGSEYCCFYNSEHYTVGGAVANTSDPLSRILRSAYGTGTVLFTNYPGHEEFLLTNSTDSPIAFWKIIGGNFSFIGIPYPVVIAMYAHKYRSGEVIGTGIFATDILVTNPQMSFFITSAIIKT